MTTPANNTTTADRNPPVRRLTVSVTEAAQMLGIGRGTAYECVRTGAIPSIRLGGRIVIPIAALERLIGLDETDAA